MHQEHKLAVLRDTIEAIGTLSAEGHSVQAITEVLDCYIEHNFYGLTSIAGKTGIAAVEVDASGSGFTRS